MNAAHFLKTSLMIIMMSILLIRDFVNADNQKADQILRRHLQYRNLANSSTMLQLNWDEELAKIARSLVEKCPLSKDDLPADESLAKFGINFGTQRVVDGRELSLISIIDKWGLERSYYVAPATCDGGECSNWIQMIYEKTNKIGCGYEVCGENQVLCCLYTEKAALPSSEAKKDKKEPVSCDLGYRECEKGCCVETDDGSASSSYTKKVTTTFRPRFIERMTTTSVGYTHGASCLLLMSLIAGLLLSS